MGISNGSSPEPEWKLRLCGNFKITLNQVQDIVDQHPLPYIDDHLTSFSGRNKFTKLIDLKHTNRCY